jgi:hypothetical protein
MDVMSDRGEFGFERRLFKPQTVLLRWRGLRGGGTKPGEASTLKEWS